MGGARLGTPLAGSVPADPAVSFAFSDRSDGNMSHAVGGGDVLAARGRLAARVGAQLAQSVFMEQVHGGQVAVVGPEDRGRGAGGREDAVRGVDALVTFDAGVALHVLVADCVPLLLADPGRALGAVHAGRAGVRSGVVAAAVEALAAPEPSAVSALIGPAIGPCCYEVPLELRDELSTELPEAGSLTKQGTPSLDLPAAVTAQLRAAGVGSITQVGACTRCEPERWFSHRAHPDGPASGRQGAVVYRRPDLQHLPGAEDGPT